MRIKGALGPTKKVADRSTHDPLRSLFLEDCTLSDTRTRDTHTHTLTHTHTHTSQISISLSFPHYLSVHACTHTREILARGKDNFFDLFARRREVRSASVFLVPCYMRLLRMISTAPFFGFPFLEHFWIPRLSTRL